MVEGGSIDKQSHPSHINGQIWDTIEFYKAVGGWSHTGSSVPISAEGTDALPFLGYFDQTDVFFKIARVLTINTR
jgi:alkaline phosphatase